MLSHPLKGVESRIALTPADTMIIELDGTDQEVQEIEKTQNEYRDGQLEHVRPQRESSSA